MTTCLVCGQPKPVRDRWGNLRATCSRDCGNILGQATFAAHQGEVDQAAVWRLTSGDRVTSTHGERITATADLTARGYTLRQVAALLRVTVRSISRYRAETNQQRSAA